MVDPLARPGFLKSKIFLLKRGQYQSTSQKPKKHARDTSTAGQSLFFVPRRVGLIQAGFVT